MIGPFPVLEVGVDDAGAAGVGSALELVPDLALSLLPGPAVPDSGTPPFAVTGGSPDGTAFGTMVESEAVAPGAGAAGAGGCAVALLPAAADELAVAFAPFGVFPLFAFEFVAAGSELVALGLEVDGGPAGCGVGGDVLEGD